jgi:hypothetical protein
MSLIELTQGKAKTKDTKNSITYNLPVIDFYDSDYDRTNYPPTTSADGSNNIFIKTEEKARQNSTLSTTFAGWPGPYLLKEIYITAPIHSTDYTIVSDDIVGEMVLIFSMNREIINTDIVVKVCVLLESSTSTKINEIDKIITNWSTPLPTPSTIFPINIDEMIPNSDFYYYDDIKNNKSKVIVFNNPIGVNKSSFNIITNTYPIKRRDISGLTATAPQSFNYLPSSQASSAGNDEIYIDCQPTGVSEDEVKTYNLPLNSAYTNSVMKVDSANQTTLLFVLVVLLAVLYFTSPYMYETLIIKNLALTTFSNNNKTFFDRLRAIELTLLFLLVLSWGIFMSVWTDIYHQKITIDVMAASVAFFVMFSVGWGIILTKRSTEVFTTEYKGIFPRISASDWKKYFTDGTSEYLKWNIGEIFSFVSDFGKYQVTSNGGVRPIIWMIGIFPLFFIIGMIADAIRNSGTLGFSISGPYVGSEFALSIFLVILVEVMFFKQKMFGV